MSKGFEMEWKGSYRCRLIPLLRKGSTSESRCHEMSARLRELMPRATDLVFLRRRGGLLEDFPSRRWRLAPIEAEIGRARRGLPSGMDFGGLAEEQGGGACRC
jgi:hypothetical protein